MWRFIPEAPAVLFGPGIQRIFQLHLPLLCSLRLKHALTGESESITNAERIVSVQRALNIIVPTLKVGRMTADCSPQVRTSLGCSSKISSPTWGIQLVYMPSIGFSLETPRFVITRGVLRRWPQVGQLSDRKPTPPHPTACLVLVRNTHAAHMVNDTRLFTDER